MDALEIDVETKEGSNELSLEGVATQIDCDDEDLSPARENVKFFSQDSVSNRSISTEKSAHELDKSKHYQRLGSAAFVGMEGLSSPNPNGGRGGMTGRGGQPVRRRTFHSTCTPSATGNDGGYGEDTIQNAAAAASAFLNMPPPRTRQNNVPVTPSAPSDSQSTQPDDKKTGTETQRRPSSMFVRKSVVESLFANEESESGNNGSSAEEANDSDALATATALATAASSGVNSRTLTQSASVNPTEVDHAQASAESTLITRSSSDGSVYNHTVRTVSSQEGEPGPKERGLSMPVPTEEEAVPDMYTVSTAATIDETHIDEPTEPAEAAVTAITEGDVSQPEEVVTETNTSEYTENTTNDTEPSSTTLPPAPPREMSDHASIHIIQPPGPNKNPAKFVAPTYVQHPVSYLKVGKGTVNISTSVSAAANISAGKNKPAQNNTSSSGSSLATTSADNVTESADVSGITNAEKAKAMVGVGSVKDRIKKFETLKSDSTDNSAPHGDGKKGPHRRASLS